MLRPTHLSVHVPSAGSGGTTGSASATGGTGTGMAGIVPSLSPAFQPQPPRRASQPLLPVRHTVQHPAVTATSGTIDSERRHGVDPDTRLSSVSAGTGHTPDRQRRTDRDRARDRTE